MDLRVKKFNIFIDLYFQLQILWDKAIQEPMFDTGMKALEYICPWNNTRKYVLLRGKEKVSLLAFREVKGHVGEYSISGFVKSSLHNKGLGVYALIMYIDRFFQEFPEAHLQTCAYLTNTGSYKITDAVGFKLKKKTNITIQSTLVREDFETNKLVQYILKKVQT